MKSARFAWPLVVLLLAIVLFQNRTAIVGVLSRKYIGNRQEEYFAWERTPQARYKQVKKNYFMDEQLCNNVISVLNGMSTKNPSSDWVLSHTTNSTFECWPAPVDPNSYYGEYSVHSDQPTAPAANDRK